MAGFFLGLDIGATKSQALVANEEGQALGYGLAGPGNHEVVGYDGLVQAMETCTNQAMRMAGVSNDQILGAGFGVAGFDWPGELSPTLNAIAQLGLKAPVEAVNDTIIGLVAGAGQGWGVGLVSGTGCNCWGWDERYKIGRVTGMGGDFGEFAGGGDIVHRAIIAIAYETFKRGPVTRLTPALIQMAGAENSLDLFEGLTLEKYQLDARAAPTVFQIAAEGDPVAVGILEWAGKELGEMANGVIRQIGLEEKAFDLVLIGSIFKGGFRVNEVLRESVHAVASRARLVHLQAPPVVGGVLIGMRLAGRQPSFVRGRLLQSARDLFRDTPTSENL